MNDTTQLTPLETSQSDDYYYDEEKHIFQQTLWENMKVFLMVIYSIAFVLGVIGNGLVIFITGFCMKKTVNNIWFLNLAVADFIFIFFLPVRIAYIALDFHWPFGEAMCKFNSTLAFINLYASVYLLMVISVDRCISVLCPVWAQNHRNLRCASFVAFGVWVLSLVLSTPNIYFRKTRLNGTVIECDTNYSHDLQQAWAVIISRFIFAFAIPFLVIIVCYGAIVQRLRRERLAQSNKPFKVITAVIVAFFVCWFPYHVFSFLDIQASKDPSLDLVRIIGIPLAQGRCVGAHCPGRPMPRAPPRPSSGGGGELRAPLLGALPASFLLAAVRRKKSQGRSLAPITPATSQVGKRQLRRVSNGWQPLWRPLSPRRPVRLLPRHPPRYATALAYSLAFINSCLNPILYVFMGHDFKERLKCSIFSVFENAFTEEGSQSTVQTKTKSSENLDSHDL